jgi:hypothetical protein
MNCAFARGAPSVDAKKRTGMNPVLHLAEMSDNTVRALAPDQDRAVPRLTPNLSISQVRGSTKSGVRTKPSNVFSQTSAM